ncbi:MAG: hypothetical protein MHM6MM_005518 [Cercozoa sp. M6MM]
MPETGEQFSSLEVLQSIPILKGVSPENLQKLADALKQVQFAENDIVFNQGDVAESFFIIQNGEAKILARNTDQAEGEMSEIATLKAGDYFGETALLTQEKRSATVKAHDGSLVCLYLGANEFHELMGTRGKLNVPLAKRKAISAEKLTNAFLSAHQRTDVERVKTDEQREMLKKAVKGNVLFANLEEGVVDRIVGEMFKMEVEGDHTLITQGEAGDNFYVVETGEFDIFVGEQHVASRGPGSSFGELALMYNSPRAATVKSIAPAVVWAVDRFAFRRTLTHVSESKLRDYESFLESVPLLSSLLAEERAKVAEALEEVSFRADSDIVKQGDPGDTFYIIREGTAKVTKDFDGDVREVQRLAAGDFFGERALLTNETRAATVTVTSERLNCLSLDRQAFAVLLGPLQDLLQRNLAKYEEAGETRQHARAQRRRDRAARKQRKRAAVKFNNLKIVGTLGKGTLVTCSL